MITVAGISVYRCIHFYGEPIRTESKCQSDGAVYRICSLCGKVAVSEILPATGHIYGDWTVEEAPTILADGRESKTCVRCGHVAKRTVPRLTEQLEQSMPRFEVTANAAGVSTTTAVSGNFVCSFRDRQTSGTFSLRYLPPEDLTPHDYDILIETCTAQEVPPAAELLFFRESADLYARADHADALHIRAEAAGHLFIDTASATSDRYAALLILPNLMGYFGTRVAFYQNGIYLEPRTISLSPAFFCDMHPAISAAAVFNGRNIVGLYGNDAETILNDALAKAEHSDYSSFATDALAAYLVYRDAIGLCGALSDNLLWVCSDGIWYPLPQSTEECLGARVGEPGLGEPSDVPHEAEGSPFEAFWNGARSDLLPQITTAKAALMTGPLAKDAVERQLRATAELLPAELLDHARNAAADALRAEGGSIDDILTWYVSRNG